MKLGLYIYLPSNLPPQKIGRIQFDKLEFGGESLRLLLTRYDASTFTAMTIKGFIPKHHRGH